MAVVSVSSTMKNYHQTSAPSTGSTTTTAGSSSRICPPQQRPSPLVCRGLKERRAARQAQASLYLMLSPRWAAALKNVSPSTSSTTVQQRLQLARLKRDSLGRQLAAGHNLAAIAHMSPASTTQFAPVQHAPAQYAPAQHVPAQPTRPLKPPCTPSVQTASVDFATAAAVCDKNLCPEMYLLRLLKIRGRSQPKISSVDAGYCQKPTAKQVKDYHSQPFMSDLVRKGDIGGLQCAVKDGRGMDASNKFGESAVHVACRRGNMDVLRFLVANGGSLTCCDDLGRFPLHEVCWGVQPRFDIVRLFLDEKRSPAKAVIDEDTNTAVNSEDKQRSEDLEGDVLNPFLVTDKRGCTPLRYVKEDSWPKWRRFLDEIVDHYWPSLV